MHGSRVNPRWKARLLLAILVATASMVVPPRSMAQLPLSALKQAPELQRAAERMTLEQPGTPPFTMTGTIETFSDLGIKSTGAIEESWYNDRWSTLTVTFDGHRMQRQMLDGHAYLDDSGFVYSFALRRVVTTLLRPFGDITPPHKTSPTRSELRLPAIHLNCVLLPDQSDVVAGMRAQNKSYCLSQEGDVRLVREAFGFQTMVNDVRSLGDRRIACDVQVLRDKRPYARVHLTSLRIAPEVTPATLQPTPAEMFRLQSLSARPIVFFTPSLMRTALITADVRLQVTTLHPPQAEENYTLVRVLEKGGHLYDAEVLAASNAKVQRLAVDVLSHSTFRFREWKEEPIAVEGVLMLSAP